MSEGLLQAILFLVAVTSNALSAVAGGGAGLIQLPVIIFLGLSFATALATHKIASVALGIGATLRHWQSSRLDRNTTLAVLIAGLPGVIAGANTILLVPEHIAKLALGILTAGLGVYSAFKPALGLQAQPEHRDTRGLIVGALVIFGIGFLNGSLTSGTGLFLTLWLIRWFGFDYKQAVAHTLILVGLFWNSTGAITLALQAPVQWSWLPALLAGSLLGGYLGAHLSITRGNVFIKRTFEGVTIVVGLKLISVALGV